MGISPKGRPQTESIPMGSSSYSRSKVTRDALSYPQGRGGGAASEIGHLSVPQK